MIKVNLSLLLFIFTSAIFAQSGSSSPYSGGGLGERNFSGTEANRHMGGLDVFTDSIHANLNNPASFGFLKLTTYSVGVNYTNNSLSSTTDSFKADTASLDYLAVSIPASSISGLSYLFSAQANIPIKKKYNFQGMFSFEPKAPLNSENNRVFYTQSINNQSVSDFIEVNLDAIGLDVTSVDISKTYKLGLGFGENKKWFLGLQRNLTKSATFNNDFFKRENIRYRDSKKWTIGGFYIPNYASFTSFWSRVVYRFGFRSEQMSLIVNNIPLTETGISFGVGLPLGGLSNANVGLEISQRGQKEFGLLKETLIALRIGLSLNDVWFIKRKFN